MPPRPWSREPEPRPTRPAPTGPRPPPALTGNRRDPRKAMPQAERSSELPLSLRVLIEELHGIETGFEACQQSEDSGERVARERDLARDIDRYLRLEEEVFNPVLDRAGIDHAGASATHACLRESLDRWVSKGGRGPFDGLQAAVRAHRIEQEQRGLPLAARELGAELRGLALELDEVRGRMKGAYGV